MLCPVCETEGEVVLADTHEVTVGTIAAMVEGRPVVACPDRHRAVPADVVGATMDATEKQIPRAKSRVFRADACHECGHALDMPTRRSARTVSALIDGTVVTVHLDLPLTRCPSCALEQVPSKSHEDFTVVIPAVFAIT